MTREKTDAPQRRRQQQAKKRRFVQAAHPVAAPIKQRQASQSASSQREDEQSAAVGRSSSLDQSSGRPRRRSPPLRTGKSIEELESILENRWGTAQNAHHGSREDDSDADFVLSFDKGSDDFRKSDLKGAAVFSRPIDPWAAEDEQKQRQTQTNSQEDEETPKNKRKPQRYDKQDAMLKRVRSNQAKLARQPKKGRGESTSDFINVPIKSRDYYDEDDFGFESHGSLISPKPVGGRGSTKSEGGPHVSKKSSLGGGIFSERNSGNSRAERGGSNSRQDLGDRKVEKSQREETIKRPKRVEAPSIPMLDSEGNEMFLTLDQADKFVHDILEQSTATSESPSDDDFAITEWRDIGITDPSLLENLQGDMGCQCPLPVQDKACPPIVAGNDCLVSTHTGSGKTLSFLAPIAQSVIMNSSTEKSMSFPKAIVIAPGRELASQIFSVAQSLLQNTGMTVSMAIGGTPFSRNVEKLRKRKPDIVVGTPGRIAELIIGRPGDKGGKMKISGLKTVVMDEFDALLQYDAHKEPTMAILQALDRQHGDALQRVLCSATAVDMMGSDSKIEQYMRKGYAHASIDENDVLVTSGVETKSKNGSTSTSARVSRTTIHGALHVPHRRLALEAVRKVLNTDPFPQQALIFVDSPRRVDIVIEKLAQMDIIAAPLHGGQGSGKGDRAEVNKALREGFVGIVVATEMAARGIDAPYLSHVINLDLPTDASHYAHRAGRCGRGGRPGVAVSITSDKRERNVPRKFAEELGITMYNVEAREGKLRIIE